MSSWRLGVFVSGLAFAAACDRPGSFVDASDHSMSDTASSDGTTMLADGIDADDATQSDGSLDAIPGDVFVDAGPAPLHLVAPLSTSTVTSRRPTLRWVLGTGMDGARVELCRTRSCTAGDIVETIDATADRARPSTDLAPGVWYWRATGTDHGTAVTRESAVWQFYVGARNVAVDTSWGSTFDVNGDGFVDIAISAAGYPDMTPMPTVARVHVYLGSSTGLAATPATTLELPDGQANAFGVSIASAGDVNGDGFADLLVAAPLTDLLGCMDAGRVYLFYGGAAGIDTTPHPIDGYTAGGCAFRFGDSVANAGDVDGDGYGDIVVGSYSWVVGGSAYAGHAFVYRGSADGPTASPVAVLTECGNGSGFRGTQVTSAGDVDGDGFGDVAVGAANGVMYADPTNTIGVVCIHRGRASGTDRMPNPQILNPNGANGHPTGFADALDALDVNGDGYADIAVGASDTTVGTRYYAGRVFIYQGGPAGTPTMPTTTLDGPAEPVNSGGRFGNAVGSVGDFDGDGFDDLGIGAPDVYPGGLVYVHRGSASGIDANATTRLAGPSSGLDITGYARSIAGVGDIDRDGYFDLVLPIPYATVGGVRDSGQIRIHPGGSAGFSNSTARSFDTPDGPSSFFGSAVTSN